MKLKVIRKFNDKNTGEEYIVDRIIECTVERGQELLSTPYVKLISIDKVEAKETPVALTKKELKAQAEADELAKAEAEAKAQAEVDELAKAEAEAKAQAEADELAKASTNK